MAEVLFFGALVVALIVWLILWDIIKRVAKTLGYRIEVKAEHRPQPIVNEHMTEDAKPWAIILVVGIVLFLMSGLALKSWRWLLHAIGFSG